MMAHGPLWRMLFRMYKMKTYGLCINEGPWLTPIMQPGTCIKFTVFKAAGYPHFVQEVWRGIFRVYLGLV